nr:rhodanese-like domain-containing protein [Paenibacillus sp. FSL R5-0912]
MNMAFKISKEIAPQKVAAQLKKGESLNMLDVREPAQETIVICRSGSRSGLACELLTEKGFNVVNMTGGLKAWTDELVRN